MAAIELVLLGTGNPMPNPDRCGAGQVVIAGEAPVLVDCGWGVSRRLFAAAIPPMTVDTVCFTHLHSDHITDTPDFLIMRWVTGAAKPLIVYGPEGTRRMIESFLAALEPDIGYRLAHHGDKLSPEGIRCVVKEVPATPERSRVTEIDGLAIDAFEVDHFPVVPALGYRFDRAGSSLILSGDTAKCASLVAAASGADMLVCEALHTGMWGAMTVRIRSTGNERGASVLDDVPSYHSTTIEVAEMARDAGVRHLVLSHLMPAPPNDGPLVDAFTAGMADVFSGKITVGRDLQRLALG